MQENMSFFLCNKKPINRINYKAGLLSFLFGANRFLDSYLLQIILTQFLIYNIIIFIMLSE